MAHLTTRHVLCLAFLVSGMCACAPLVNADQKNDIKDPVLQQVIQTFSGRMPRFIDAHGKSVFVADEPVTRASLLMTLYEYDKPNRLNAAAISTTTVTRREFDELKEKLSLLNTIGAGAQNRDIVDIINALEPNMPILLDSTLTRSKVFNDLSNELSRRKAKNSADPAVTAEIAELKQALLRAHADIAELQKKVSVLENGASQKNSPADGKQ